MSNHQSSPNPRQSPRRRSVSQIEIVTDNGEYIDVCGRRINDGDHIVVNLWHSKGCAGTDKNGAEIDLTVMDAHRLAVALYLAVSRLDDEVSN